MATTDQAVALIDAIRTFTVEAPGGRPNGESERRILALRNALDDGTTKQAQVAFRRLMSSLAVDGKALRVAAEGYFGGDFRKPGVRP